MVHVNLPGEGVIDIFDTVREALERQREVWCEDEAPLLVYLTDDNGQYLACMMSDQCYREVCHTLYADGTSESHRCHYVLDADGMYERTEVTLIGE